MRINVEIAVDSKGVATFRQIGTAAEGAATQVDTLAKRATFLDRVFQGIGQGIGQRAFAAVEGAARAAGDALAYLVQRGAEVRDVTESFGALTAAAGLSGDALLKAGQVGAAGMISNFELMRASNKALLLDLPITAAGMQTLAAGAATLGDAIGQGPTEALNTMLEALGRGQDRLLKQMGIDIDAAAAQEKYAAALGTTGDKLSEAGKKAALYDAAISAIRQKTADLGGVQLSLADQLDQVKTRWQNLLDSMAMAIQTSPAVAAAVSGLSQILLDLIGYLERNQAAFQDLVKVGLTLFLGALAVLGAAVTGALAVLQGLYEGTTKVGVAFLKSVEGVAKFGAVTSKLKLDLAGAKFFEGVAADAKSMGDALQGFGDGWTNSIGKAKEGSASLTLSVADLAAKVYGTGTAAKSTGNALSDLKPKAAVATDGIKLAAAAAKLAEEQLKAMTASMAAFFDSVAKSRDARESLTGLLGPSASDATIEMGRLADATQRLGGVAELSDAQLVKLINDMRAQASLGGENAFGFDTLGKAMDEAANRSDHVASQVGFATKVAESGTKKAAEAAVDWSKKLQDVANAAQALGPGFAGIAKFIGAISAGMASLQSISLKGGITGGKGLGGLLSNLTGALGAAGAAISIGKSILGLFKSSPAEKAAKEAGKLIGGKVSKELAEKIAADSKRLKIDMRGASLINLDKLISESGKGASAFVPQIKELMTAIARGSVPAKEGMAALDASFAMLAEEASKAKFASLEMFQVMKQARETGVMTEGMKAAISSALEAMAQGLSKTGGLAIASEQAAINSATIFGLVWTQTVAEKGLVGAAEALGPAFQELQKRLEESGFGEAAAAIFAPIQQQFALATDEMFAGAANAAMGYADILKNAINTAMPITIEQFRAFGGVAQDSFNQARDAALALGLSTEEAQTQAFLAIAPLLGELVQAAAAYGFELDAGTQALIDQAKAAGVAFPVSPVDRMANAVERLVEVLEKALGLSQGIGEAFNGVVTGNAPDRMPGPMAGHGFAGGGIARGPLGGYGARLHGTEAVMTLPQLYGEMAGIVSSATAGMLAGMIRPSTISSSTGGSSPVVGAATSSGDNDALLRELVAEVKALRRAQENAPAPTVQIGQEQFGQIVRTTQRRVGR